MALHDERPVVAHRVWYDATNFKRPYPGETKVRPPSDFMSLLASRTDSDDCHTSYIVENRGQTLIVMREAHAEYIGALGRGSD